MPYDLTLEYPITSNDKNRKIHDFLLDMKNKLDSTVHGMQEAKEEIILEVMKRLTDIDSQVRKNLFHFLHSFRSLRSFHFIPLFLLTSFHSG